MVKFINYISKNAFLRIGFLVGVYSILFPICLWFSYLLRFDFFLNNPSGLASFYDRLSISLLYILPLKLISIGLAGQYSRLVSYFSTPDLAKILFGASAPSLAFLFLTSSTSAVITTLPPRGVLLIDCILSFGAVLVVRLGLRLIRERSRPSAGDSRQLQATKKVAIIGAGDTGSQLIREFLTKKDSGLEPVAVFDDDQTKWKTKLHGIPVLGEPCRIPKISEALALDMVILAIPTAPLKRVSEIIKMLSGKHFKLITVPSINQLASGKIKLNQLRHVDIEDLLQRPMIQLNKDRIQGLIAGRICLVTGAGGSIGSELCRQILQYGPKHLILLEQSEVQLFQIEQELLDTGFQEVDALICDILDEPRLETIFNQFHPEIIFHAAAHKHVPLMESQPSEAIKNNLLGTSVLASCAMRHQTSQFVMISTDKAINPTNVMGATKRAAELYIQALNRKEGNKTNFVAVRFGNVLGSSGSVIPTFKKQIANGGPVKVTHKDMTRYFMTIPEACSLVLEAGTIGEGGEIFVLDMGEPVKIVHLAEQLIRLSGMKLDQDIQIEFTGLRPGEKMFEELQHEGENIAHTSHDKVMRFISTPLSFEKAELMTNQFREEVDRVPNTDLKNRLQEYIPEYKPYTGDQ